MAEVRKKILVVDDIEDWQKTLVGLLEDEGYKVKAVGDREAALKELKGHKFGLAIIDIRLDETDEDNIAGLNLASELKSIQGSLPVVIITGYDTPSAIDLAFKPDETGNRLAIDFVKKTEASELVDVVKKILEPSY
jgi:CheY-like chemotaxis protein